LGAPPAGNDRFDGCADENVVARSIEGVAMPEPTAQVSTTVDASPTAVWEALTDPALMREYFMGAEITTDWVPGHPITYVGNYEGKPYEDKGEVLVVEPERQLSMSHWSPLAGTADTPDNYHVVTFELHGSDGHTEVTLTQSNLTGGETDADRENREHYETNWQRVLEGLKRVVES
jgi:uncharacterized protein YndB with AHSA1/START domain